MTVYQYFSELTGQRDGKTVVVPLEDITWFKMDFGPNQVIRVSPSGGIDLSRLKEENKGYARSALNLIFSKL